MRSKLLLLSTGFVVLSMIVVALDGFFTLLTGSVLPTLFILALLVIALVILLVLFIWTRYSKKSDDEPISPRT